MQPTTYIPNQTPSQPTPNPSQGSGSSWEKWLPTVGSLVGSVGGDILGGLLTLPTGGIVNPWDTSTVLSGLLAGGGQAVENGLQGKNPFQINDLTQAGIAAGGNLAGLGVGKLLGMGGSALSGIGASQAAKVGTQDVAKQTAQDIIDKQATNDVNYAGLGNKVQQHLNFGSNQKFFDNLGVDSTNPTALNNAAKAGTFVDSKYSQALQNSGQTIDTGQFANNAFDAMKQNGITDLGSSSLGKAISSSGIPTDELSGLPAKTIDASQGRSLAQSINTQMRDLSSKIDSANFNGQTAAASSLENQYNTLKTIQDNLYKQIDTPQVNKNIASLTVSPAERQTLVQQYGDKVGNYVADKTNAAQTGQELRKIMAPFAQTNEATSMANDFNANVSAGTAAKNRAAAEADQVLKNAGVDTSKGKSATSLLNKAISVGKIGGAVAGIADPHQNSLLRIAEIAPEAGTLLANGTAASVGGNLLSKIGAGLPIAGAGVASVAGAPQPNSGQQLNQQQGGGMIPQNNQLPIIPNPYSQPLQNAQLLQSEQAVDPLLSGLGNTSQNVQSLTQSSQKFNAAINGVRNILNLFKQAGGGQGPAGGLLANLQSKLTGGEASRLSKTEQQVAPLLSQLTGAPVSTANMPSIYENPQTAQQNVNALINLLGSLSASQ